MVVLLMLRADYSLLTLKPAHSSPYLPGTAETFGKLAQESDELASMIGFWVQGSDKR